MGCAKLDGTFASSALPSTSPPLEELVLKFILLPWKLLLLGQESELNYYARSKSVIWKNDTWVVIKLKFSCVICEGTGAC